LSSVNVSEISRFYSAHTDYGNLSQEKCYEYYGDTGKSMINFNPFITDYPVDYSVI
jgi:hypothetical protein